MNALIGPLVDEYDDYRAEHQRDTDGYDLDVECTKSATNAATSPLVAAPPGLPSSADPFVVGTVTVDLKQNKAVAHH